tara:strand:+ start:462 stop:944 length:483 start_codon:yes stop_codon:yes gene_type:complete
MFNTKILTNEYVIEYNNLLLDNDSDYDYFKQLGWSLEEIKTQLNKNNNFSLGLWESEKLVGLVFGELLIIEKKSEYEIFIIYVHKKYRKKGCGSYLLQSILKSNFTKPLQRISLDVSVSNIPAIKLYNKNNFIQIGIRKKYFLIDSKRQDALIFEKKINE